MSRENNHLRMNGELARSLPSPYERVREIERIITRRLSYDEKDLKALQKMNEQLRDSDSISSRVDKKALELREQLEGSSQNEDRYSQENIYTFLKENENLDDESRPLLEKASFQLSMLNREKQNIYKQLEDLIALEKVNSSGIEKDLLLGEKEEQVIQVRIKKAKEHLDSLDSIRIEHEKATATTRYLIDAHRSLNIIEHDVMSNFEFSLVRFELVKRQSKRASNDYLLRLVEEVSRKLENILNKEAEQKRTIDAAIGYREPVAAADDTLVVSNASHVEQIVDSRVEDGQSSSNGSSELVAANLSDALIEELVGGKSQENDARLKALEEGVERTSQRVSSFARIMARFGSEQAAFEEQLVGRQQALANTREKLEQASVSLAETAALQNLVEEAQTQTKALETTASRVPELQASIEDINSLLAKASESISRLPALEERQKVLDGQQNSAAAQQEAQLEKIKQLIVEAPSVEEKDKLYKLIDTFADKNSLERIPKSVSASIRELERIEGEVNSKHSLINAMDKARNLVLQQVLAWLTTHTHYQTPANRPVFSVARTDKVYGRMWWSEVHHTNDKTQVSPDNFKAVLQ